MKTLQWEDGALKLIDQTRLPLEFAVVECRTYQEVADAIRNMIVRGAPAIGVAAAYGFALGALQSKASDKGELLAELSGVTEALRQTRPTAVNLFWALQRMNAVAQSVDGDLAEMRRAILSEAREMAREDEERNRRIGGFGAELVRDGDTILTHCNAGALATVDYGTALGVIRAAHEQGKCIHVLVDETRPFLQGARLTAWEMEQAGIPATLITDNMAGHFMSRGRIDMVVVGADRIAANGDVANKIGTYTVAVLAKENGIPFYVAAPTSTVDLSLKSGQEIPIEERSEGEVLYINGKRIAPEGISAAHPAFDVTPNRYVTAIITEQGVVRSPYEFGLPKVVRAST
ncbi:MAG: S-methyl-5-thioribose-1-phosphate isomerase [Chloroflexi bacterium]|nr:S-methyl-5-thioribose-1-phosphate isomerase [Chloroflexota bacterium]